MIIKYLTGVDANGKIERVQCTRETAACVYLPTSARGNKNSERREAKKSEWAQYHDSWDEAHAYLIAEAESELDSIRRKLEAARGKLGSIKGMRKPEGEA